ncbi:hypothetical protein ACFYTC_31695 [Actinomadura nitritigenes]|uniref:hypothetical protein n=1 Tax=Actinomadura nitritigenes TaxID=134602 RepID=UPI0036785832
MPLVDRYENATHRPEHSALVVRGTPWTIDPPPELAHLNLDVLDEHAFAGFLKGDLAGAGNGWIHATTADLNHVVLEAHDALPPHARWDGDVMESPFLTTGDHVDLTQVIAESPMQGVRLGPPGLYRVRIHRKRLGDHWEWLLQFWPADDVLDPPRRLSRDSRPWDDHSEPFARTAMDLVAHVLWSPGQATKADLAERLLLPLHEIDAALDHALRRGLLHVDDLTTATISMAPVDRRPPEIRDPFAAVRQHRAALETWAEANDMKLNQRGNIPPAVEERFRRHRGPLG